MKKQESSFKYYILTVLSTLIVLSLCQKFEQMSIIDRINSLKTTWKAGENKYFIGKSFEDIKGLMGALQTPPEMRLRLKQIQPLKNLPQNFSSIEAWPGCESIKQIRDQGPCGSCWAFGAVEAISDRICIASGQKLQTRISAQDLLTCCGFTCGHGCHGGYSDGAWNYYYSKGLVTGNEYGNHLWCQPYSFKHCDHHTTGRFEPCPGTQPTPACSKSCNPDYPKPYKEDLHHGRDVYTVPMDPKKIQTEIMTYGPVEAVFMVYEDFLHYKSGVYKRTTSKKVGLHAVKILGWGVEDKVPYWLVANSWNEDWGDGGFFKILRGENECHIEDQITAGIPRIPEQLEFQ